MSRPTVCLDNLIADIFIPVRDDMLDQGHAEYWLKGGRGSTKSSFFSLMIVLGLLMDREANAIIFRKVANTLRKSVYEQVIWAIDNLGVTRYFKCSVSPMEIVHIHTGQRILFYGADDPSKSKSIKLAHGYFKYLWFEELAEFDGMDDITTIQASVIRGGGVASTLCSYNPPMSAQNWTNAEVLTPREDRLVHHSNYTQVPREWLGDSFIALAEAKRATNERAYRHMYLGEVTGTGGQVFDNLELRPIGPEEWQGLHTYSGHDFGFAVDPDAFVRCAYSRKRRTLYIVAEYVAPGTSLDALARRIKERAGGDIVTADNEDPRSISEIRSRGVRVIAAKKGPDSVHHGMRWLQTRDRIIIDSKLCPNAAREFSAYEYDRDRNGNFLSRYPDKNNHTIDATRYAMESVSTQSKAIAIS